MIVKQFRSNTFTHRGWTVTIDMDNDSGWMLATKGEQSISGMQVPHINPPYGELMDAIDIAEGVVPPSQDEMDEIAFDLFKQIMRTGHADITRHGCRAHICFKDECDGDS